MPAIKWTGKEFKVTKQLLTEDVFGEWIREDGRTLLEDTFRRMPVRWFFGLHRARRKLRREAKTALKPKASFAAALKRQLDELPDLIRKVGIRIRQRGHKDLISANGEMALVTIPRAITRNEFAVFLTDKLAASAALKEFRGLARRVLKHAAFEAEELFFSKTHKGAQFVHPDGRTIVLGAEADYSWQLGENGHYYCAYAGKDGHDLTRRGDLRKFKKEMDEIMYGHRIHLKRLRKDDITFIADVFRGKRQQPQPLPAVSLRK